MAPAAFVCALVGLGLGLALRPTELVERARWAEASGLLPAGARVLAARPTFTVALGQDGLLWLVPHVALDAPDLLVYRAGARDEGGEQLPPDAQLLGPTSPSVATSFESRDVPVTLILYSLGHRRRFDTVTLRGEGAR